MTWNREQIDSVALLSAVADHGAFERIGLTEIAQARVLDVGCFDGFNTVLKLGPYENIAQVVGLDPSEEALALARAATDDERFVWWASTFEDYEPDEPFDVVYLSHTFQHLPDKQAAARKAFRCLKPGGWLVIKTVDDSLKASSPDPDRVMARVFARYEEAVRSRMPHTACTDRDNGAACYGLLRDAGFDPVEVTVSHASTAGLSLEERLLLFDRMTYFRNPLIDGERDAVMTQLLAQWKRLFERDDYYFDSPTFTLVGRKPCVEGAEGVPSAASAALEPFPVLVDGAVIELMCEDDLGDVMAIEMRSFPNPWAPLAFAMELRHNGDAVYVVVRDEERKVRGYIGWWVVDGKALITHVAVDPSARRRGLGAQLVGCALDRAAARGALEMGLQLREGNQSARALYRSAGFEETGRIPDYYQNPVEDAIIMARSLQDRVDRISGTRPEGR